jgi:hypothetical protein
MFTDAQKTDIRRHCGYPAYGATSAGNMGWRFFTAYGALEYRLNNLSCSEETVALTYIATLNQLEAVVPGVSDNLDSDGAASWQHNPNELADRLTLLDSWRLRLCKFLGVPPGEGLNSDGVAWIV